MDQPARHVGHATLALLVEDWSLPILRALMDGPRRPSQLEQRLPGVPHSPLMRRLSELRARGLAKYERHSGLPPAAEYTLTAPGRALLSVAGAAERWERNWRDQDESEPSALKIIGDQRTREILLTLADGPLSAAQLERSIPLSRSKLRERLAGLVNGEILAHSDTHKYELTDRSRDLMLVAVAAARWEWEFDQPAESPAAVNVARTLQMYAPKAQLAADLHGTCAIHVDGRESAAVIAFAADGRQLRQMPHPPTKPQASCKGPARAWCCDGLLLGRWRDVVSQGDRALMAAILASIATALIA
jgi:DNA-binding HxlR family transcriptional regulator